MVWEGKEVIKTGRTLIGATNPLASAPGTIRGDYGIEVGRNIIHGSGEMLNTAVPTPDIVSTDCVRISIKLRFADYECMQMSGEHPHALATIKFQT